jgi:hypothetical protein
MGNNPYDPDRPRDEPRTRLREAQLAWEKACNELLEANRALCAGRDDLRRALSPTTTPPGLPEVGHE